MAKTSEQRLDDLEERVDVLEETEAPLTLIRHVWESAMVPTGTFLVAATKKLLPLAGTALLTLILAGSVSVPGCPSPTPTPVPVVPPPAPVVVKSKLIISFLHDQNTDTQQWANVAYGSARNQLKAAGHVVRVYEKGQDEYTALNFAPFVAKAGGLPAAVFQLPDGTVKSAVKMPGTDADLLKATQDAGGF